MKVSGSVSKLAGGFAMVAADRALDDKEGVLASFDATFGRSYALEAPTAKPSLGL